MRLIDEETVEIRVARDPEHASVELHLGVVEDGARVVRLTRDEARQLASLILFQVARLDRPNVRWGPAYPIPERRSA